MKLPLARILPAITGASCLLALAACGGGSAGSAEPSTNIAPPAPDPSSPSDPIPSPQEFVVRGEVLSFETGMIANSSVNLWIQTPGAGYSYWWAYGRLQSDDLGLFEAQVPGSVITLHAFQAGFVQPCAVQFQATEDVEVRIEMQSVSALNVINAPRPQLSSEPAVTGTIFESTQDGRRAIEGAVLFAEDAMEVGRADTISDRSGGFYLCNLPTETYIDVRKPGYMPVLVGPVGGPEPAILEIGLKRIDDLSIVE